MLEQTFVTCNGGRSCPILPRLGDPLWISVRIPGQTCPLYADMRRSCRGRVIRTVPLAYVVREVSRAWPWRTVALYHEHVF
jgi:hypothetical protein